MKVKRIIMLFIVILALGQPATAQFIDIEGDPAEDKISALEKTGILLGVGENKFSPDSPVTRAEFAAMVNRAAGYGEKGNKMFSDVKPSDWFYNDVSIAANAGLIDGFPDGTYRPDELISHEQAVKILVCAYRNSFSIDPSGEMATLYDDYYSISPWAREYVSVGTVLGIAKGYENLTGTDTVLDNESVFGIKNNDGILTRFNPQGYTTRSQAADMIYDLLNALKVSERIK